MENLWIISGYGWYTVPSSNDKHSRGKSPSLLMGESTISMVMFNSKLFIYQRVLANPPLNGRLMASESATCLVSIRMGHDFLGKGPIGQTVAETWSHFDGVDYFIFWSFVEIRLCLKKRGQWQWNSWDRSDDHGVQVPYSQTNPHGSILEVHFSFSQCSSSSAVKLNLRSVETLH